MNGRFVLTWEVPPPQGRTLMVRSGGSVFSAALSRYDGQWRMIFGAGEEVMPRPPQEWWLTDELAKQLKIDITAVRPQPEHTQGGCGLFFVPNDSEKQPGGDGEAL